MELTDLHLLSASEAARLIRAGMISSEELVEACLARVREVDPQVEAWTFLDRDYAMRQAERLDEWRRAGHATGPLHGIPIGIKDIFDTGDMPTEDGSVLHAGRTPRRDAVAVTRLRQKSIGDQLHQDRRADTGIQVPQPRRLRDRQPQTGHFQVFAPNAIEQQFT